MRTILAYAGHRNSDADVPSCYISECVSLPLVDREIFLFSALVGNILLEGFVNLEVLHMSSIAFLSLLWEGGSFGSARAFTAALECSDSLLQATILSGVCWAGMSVSCLLTLRTTYPSAGALQLAVTFLPWREWGDFR